MKKIKTDDWPRRPGHAPSRRRDITTDYERDAQAVDRNGGRA